MSDFDKEAEREKLREKYERDQQKREASEQMSELLLQGATMTNAHCSECGDPIFRYEGQEFCATCEKAVDRGDANADNGTQSDGDASDESAESTVEVTSPNEEGRVVFGGDGDARESQSENAQSNAQSADSRSANARRPPTERDTEPSASPPPRSDADGTQDAGVPAAHDALVRTLVGFSQRAEATDDPRRAREHLQAAREAAETLAALRR